MIDKQIEIQNDWVIIVGKGIHSSNQPVLLPTVVQLVQHEIGLQCKIDGENRGRVVVSKAELQRFVNSKSWR